MPKVFPTNEIYNINHVMPNVYPTNHRATHTNSPRMVTSFQGCGSTRILEAGGMVGRLGLKLVMLGATGVVGENANSRVSVEGA